MADYEFDPNQDYGDVCDTVLKGLESQACPEKSDFTAAGSPEVDAPTIVVKAPSSQGKGDLNQGNHGVTHV